MAKRGDDIRVLDGICQPTELSTTWHVGSDHSERYWALSLLAFKGIGVGHATTARITSQRNSAFLAPRLVIYLIARFLLVWIPLVYAYQPRTITLHFVAHTCLVVYTKKDRESVLVSISSWRTCRITAYTPILSERMLMSWNLMTIILRIFHMWYHFETLPTCTPMSGLQHRVRDLVTDYAGLRAAYACCCFIPGVETSPHILDTWTYMPHLKTLRRCHYWHNEAMWPRYCIVQLAPRGDSRSFSARIPSHSAQFTLVCSSVAEGLATSKNWKSGGKLWGWALESAGSAARRIRHAS